ncbi:hypothetical protein BX661DRAFT_198628 [Kickxella alabastrina]|uniref:uncharacterized protein n=1 Tax=Kickxella alabastrina TaxID=61397 RepID=UPI00221F0D7D|nr:uncharacterized protein BX661DRAFT_198628 [Kickxella alabastrina]KAI7827349.1 hypothetical protein BX661DRAFT_198628 [Kickxella alabastrina]
MSGHQPINNSNNNNSNNNNSLNLFGAGFGGNNNGMDTSNGMNLFNNFNDLSSFGVDLNALEMAGGGGGGSHGPSSGNDLSSIQLMSLNAAGANGGNIGVNSTPMMMMAALNNASVQQQNQQQHNQQQQQQKAKSRASSQSSDDMGDIPLAQLALAQAPVQGQNDNASSSNSNGRRRNCPPSHCDTNTWSHTGPSVSRTANQLPLSNTAVTPTSSINITAASSSAARCVIESGSSGVHSTHGICAIRIMGGGVNGSEESSGSGDDVIALKPTVKEFMVGVAEVQAGLRWQHAQLVSDVAGVERDLVLWEDVARLLADAVDEGLAISAAATTESSA